jgi:hypothetical protein
MPYMFQTFLSFLYEKIWRFLFYCRKNFVICSKFRAVSLFLSTARIRFYLILAVEIFLSSSWHFQKKCRAVEIRAVAFRAVDPDSNSHLLKIHLLKKFAQHQNCACSTPFEQIEKKVEKIIEFLPSDRRRSLEIDQLGSFNYEMTTIFLFDLSSKKDVLNYSCIFFFFHFLTSYNTIS